MFEQTQRALRYNQRQIQFGSVTFYVHFVPIGRGFNRIINIIIIIISEKLLEPLCFTGRPKFGLSECQVYTAWQRYKLSEANLFVVDFNFTRRSLVDHQQLCSSTVASLGLVSMVTPGAATDGVSYFSRKKTYDLLSHRCLQLLLAVVS